MEPTKSDPIIPQSAIGMWNNLSFVESRLKELESYIVSINIKTIRRGGLDPREREIESSARELLEVYRTQRDKIVKEVSDILYSIRTLR